MHTTIALWSRGDIYGSRQRDVLSPTLHDGRSQLLPIATHAQFRGCTVVAIEGHAEVEQGKIVDHLSLAGPSVECQILHLEVIGPVTFTYFKCQV